MSNRTTLDQLDHMPIGDIAKLPVDHLAMLIDDVQSLKARAKQLDDWLNGALSIRYKDALDGTGTRHVEDDGFDVSINIPKKPECDQAELRQALEQIRAWGEDPAEYVKTEHKVSEAAYKAWPSAIRKVFEPARTVKAEKPTFTLKQREAA